jgi:hypothetical protein
MNEVRMLGFILTRAEFEAVLGMQDPTWLQEARPQAQQQADADTTIIH